MSFILGVRSLTIQYNPSKLYVWGQKVKYQGHGVLFSVELNRIHKVISCLFDKVLRGTGGLQIG